MAWCASLRFPAALRAVMACCAAQSQTGDFPARPVRITVSSAAGGASDTVAKLVADRLAPRWKQSVTVENRTGGAAVIATNPAVRNDLRYDTARDLRALLHFGAAPAVLTIRADFPARTLAEFSRW